MQIRICAFFCECGAAAATSHVPRYHCLSQACLLYLSLAHTSVTNPRICGCATLSSVPLCRCLPQACLLCLSLAHTHPHNYHSATRAQLCTYHPCQPMPVCSYVVCPCVAHPGNANRTNSTHFTTSILMLAQHKNVGGGAGSTGEAQAPSIQCRIIPTLTPTHTMPIPRQTPTASF